MRLISLFSLAVSCLVACSAPGDAIAPPPAPSPVTAAVHGDTIPATIAAFTVVCHAQRATCLMDAAYSTGAVVYAWDFADGTTATTTAEQVTHTFRALGYFDVQLTITDALGATSSTIHVVFIRKF